MSERDIDARLDAVERALTDGDTDLTDLREASGVVDDLQALEARLETVESRLDELEAGLEAVRGYAGNVRAVNREVERRASAALAKAETVEAAVESDGRPRNRQHDRPDAPDDPVRPEPGENGPTAGHTDHMGRVDTVEGPQSRRPSAETADAREPGRDRVGPDSSDPEGRRQRDGGGKHGDRQERDGERRRDGDRPQPDADRTRGPAGERDTAGARRRRDRSVAIDDQASNGEPQGENSETESDRDTQTEQFIERVRDAL